MGAQFCKSVPNVDADINDNVTDCCENMQCCICYYTSPEKREEIKRKKIEEKLNKEKIKLNKIKQQEQTKLKEEQLKQQEQTKLKEQQEQIKQQEQTKLKEQQEQIKQEEQTKLKILDNEHNIEVHKIEDLKIQFSFKSSSHR